VIGDCSRSTSPGEKSLGSVAPASVVNRAATNPATSIVLCAARRNRLAATGRAAPVSGCFAFAVLKVAVFDITFRWTATS